MVSELRTRLFTGLGFVRKQCPYCRHNYWTLNQEQENCGDQPCNPYWFIGNPPTRISVEGLRDVRERFLRFFERHGHVRIRRYPVVARWRTDVYLVGASIYDFQPWVTEGIVPPPANPLTISQPSIRLTDVDKVGRSGRHLTGFEMMAHHAFNYPDKYVYWIDETVELAHEFFTKELGIRDDELTYKESMWEGGGNAGECLEVLVRGLEVATLVFMHYKVIDGKYVDMPMRIVDTGYGLERIYWVITGKPTVYDAVFGQFIEGLRARLGLPRPDEELLKHMATYFGQLDPEVTNLEKAYDYIARKVGLDTNEVKRLLRIQETLYLMADHGRAVSWIIADGVIPSNSGVGYLARLLLRRILRSMYIAGIEVPLTEVFDLQLNYLRDDYPEVYEERQSILELVSSEESKFRELIRGAPSIIERIIRDKERRTGKRELTVDDLVLLYDSHGIPPEIAKELSEAKFGIKVSIPEDFYSRLVTKHQRPDVGEKPKVDVNPLEVQDLPHTRELFYEDMYMFNFKARVIKVLRGRYVVLDQTAFFPETGGQLADHGIIRHSGGEAKVIDVQRVGPVIIHVIEGTPPGEGEEVYGVVDSERRWDLTRMHTATHILLQSIRRVLGRHIWQAGVEKNIPLSRLDVTHHRLPTREELRRIEELANKVVYSNQPVSVHWMDRTEAESRYGFYIYQGGVAPGAKIRIVKVGPEDDPYDVEACGGTHLRQTGYIGMIKVVKVEKIQEGVVRFIFTTGRYALNYIQSMEDTMSELSTKLGQGDLLSAVEGVLSELRSREERIRRLTQRLLNNDLELLRSREEVINGVTLTYTEFSNEERSYIQELARRYLAERPGALILVTNKKNRGSEYYVYVGTELAERLSASDMIAVIGRRVNGKGGGSRTYGQGYAEAGVSLEEVVNAVREAIRSLP